MSTQPFAVSDVCVITCFNKRTPWKSFRLKVSGCRDNKFQDPSRTLDDEAEHAHCAAGITEQ